jgi:uncharacterized protein (TIGR02246 family)
MVRDAEDETAIRTLVETWHRATAVGDVSKVLSLMAEDAVFLAPERPPVRGQSSFAQGLTDVLKTHTISSSGDIREVTVSDAMAYCWTDLTVTITPLDGSPPKVRRGPALSIFGKRSNGSWVLVRDANMLAEDSTELALKVDNLERELMADGPGG